MKKYGIIPIEDMWNWWPAWVVFRDIDGDWCDCTGHVIRETKDEYIIGNRPDHQRIEILKSHIELILIEEIEDES